MMMMIDDWVASRKNEIGAPIPDACCWFKGVLWLLGHDLSLWCVRPSEVASLNGRRRTPLK